MSSTASLSNANLYAAMHERTVLVSAIFPDPANPNPTAKEYTYKAMKEQQIKEGDVVVVASDHSKSGLTFVQVTKVRHQEVPGASFLGEFDNDVEYKWVVMKLDTRFYDETLEKEAQFAKGLLTIARQKQRAELLEDITKRVGAEGVKMLEAQLK